MLILGIESSCDETAAAVVKDGKTILSSVVSTQIEVHNPYGGVVPELASRKHIEAIAPVVKEAVRESGININQLDAIAATRGPGLIGSLLVGFSFAKAYAFALGITWTGVNHLEGHINSVFLGPESPSFPFIALLVSGGHTSLYYVKSNIEFQLLGQTRDDAAGEAFDKVAKMLGLGYPGGTVISSLAEKGDPEKIKFPRAYLPSTPFDFSFSGLKTSVNRYIQINENYKDRVPDIAAGFQESVVDVLSKKVLSAANEKGCDRVAIVGGVAANKRLRERIKNDASKKEISVYIPSIELCGDNGAMIAAAGYHYIKKRMFSELDCDVYSRVNKKIQK